MHVAKLESPIRLPSIPILFTGKTNNGLDNILCWSTRSTYVELCSILPTNLDNFFFFLLGTNQSNQLIQNNSPLDVQLYDNENKPFYHLSFPFISVIHILGLCPNRKKAEELLSDTNDPEICFCYSTYCTR